MGVGVGWGGQGGWGGFLINFACSVLKDTSILGANCRELHQQHKFCMNDLCQNFKP